MHRPHSFIASVIACLIAGVLSLAGCSTPLPSAEPAAAPAAAAPAGTAPPVAPPASREPAVPSAPALPAAAADSKVASVELPDHLNPASDISMQRSIYFAFDESNVEATYLPIVERHAKYLVANPAVAVRLEGHADERGGPEYNLALGQRRAEAVARALRLLGVPGNRVEAVSFGEERPKARGHDEAAWAQNRRADFAYPLR